MRTLADKFEGKRFNSPNDLTLDGKGRVYFTDPRYVGDEKRELDHESVYRVDPDGKVTRVDHGRDEAERARHFAGRQDALRRGEQRRQEEAAATAAPSRSTPTARSAGKELYDFGEGRGIDGMTVATDGTIVATAGSKDAAGVYFFSPEGKKLGVPADARKTRPTAASPGRTARRCTSPPARACTA